MEDDPQQDNVPAWERPSSQSARIEDPDLKQRPALIAWACAFGIGLILFLMVPFLIFSCGVSQMVDTQRSFPPASTMDQQIKDMQLELDNQPPPVSPPAK